MRHFVITPAQKPVHGVTLHLLSFHPFYTCLALYSKLIGMSHPVHCVALASQASPVQFLPALSSELTCMSQPVPRQDCFPLLDEPPNLIVPPLQGDAPTERARLGGPSCGQACDVFICHREPEGNLVRHITERLQRANLIVSADNQMRKAGEPWPHVLATLRGVRGVLLLLTPGFEESPWCLEEARAVAARLDEARGNAAAQAAILPVFVGRGPSWDEEKLLAAFVEFWAGPEHSDFAQQRAKESDLAAGLVEHWREALRSVAPASYTMHSFEPCRCESWQFTPFNCFSCALAH